MGVGSFLCVALAVGIALQSLPPVLSAPTEPKGPETDTAKYTFFIYKGAYLVVQALFTVSQGPNRRILQESLTMVCVGPTSLV